MTEAEIVAQISTIIDRLWSIQQWWASVSFGLIIVAHVAPKQLNAIIVALIVSLYTVYSIYVYEVMGETADVLAAFTADLVFMQQTIGLSTTGAASYIEQPTLSPILVPIALIGTYIAATSYLIYRYFRIREVPKA